jgi:unsaturated rhamnogalacturonyl hydrolase
MIVAIILALLFLIILLIDIIVQFMTWQSRIKIGRFVDDNHWQNKVVQMSIKWLKNTPTVKLTDNNRLILIDILKGNYKRNSIQHWQQAALLLGLTQYYNKTKEDKIKTEIQNFINTQLNVDGTWKQLPQEIDSVIMGYALIMIPFLDKQHYKPAFDAIYQLILNLKGIDGTIAYKKHNQQFRFVDTIGFICPFLVVYGTAFQVPEAVDLSINQIATYNKYGMLHNTYIPCHTYAVNSNFSAGLYGWGRGLGWYAIGLIDAWNALPDSHLAKKSVEENVILFAKTALQFQNENGSYHWLIVDKSSRLDSSTAATLGWFFTQASKIPSIETECKIASKKSLQYLQTVTQRNGAIDFSQGDTKSIGVYSKEFSILPFTQGFCLRNLAIQ